MPKLMADISYGHPWKTFRQETECPIFLVTVCAIYLVVICPIYLVAVCTTLLVLSTIYLIEGLKGASIKQLVHSSTTTSRDLMYEIYEHL